MKPIFDGKYEISESGSVYSHHIVVEYGDYLYPGELKTHIGTDGYPSVHLHKDGETITCSIHRLLAVTFIPNPENKPQVNHKDGNKLNYALSNLEWATPSENMQHAFDAGLVKPPQAPKKVVDTCSGKEYPTIKAAAKDLNIHYSTCKKYLLGILPNKTCLQYA
jgi:HNH endonuclease